MKYPYLISFIFFSLLSISTLIGQRFPCDGKLLIASNDGTSTSISHPVVLPFSLPFFTPLVRYNNARFDAIGFNSRDNYIYGVQENSNVIVRLKSDYSYDTLGVVSEVDTLRSNAGDCTPEGLYLCYDYSLNQILAFDVVDEFGLVKQIDLFWDPSSNNTGSFNVMIYDFVIDPNNPNTAYAYQSVYNHNGIEPSDSRGHILQINLDFEDPNVGMVMPITAIDHNIFTHIGGLLFSIDSGLYAYGSNEEGENPRQNKFYGINKVSGEVADWNAIMPKSIFGDGCSCPFAFTFRCRVPTEGMYCNDDLKTFVLEISNSSYNAVEDILLLDTLPEGMIIEEVNGILDDNAESISGFGTNLLEIKGLRIPARTTVNIEIEVRSVDAAVGPNYNQGYLYNMPERFEGVLVSDDRATQIDFGDSSLFIVVPRDFAEVNWEVSSPTDCIVANDGKIKVTSPQFFPGQDYVVKLRNKFGWDELTYNVIIDNNKSFVIDSLLPGDYQVFEVRSLSDRCSLAIKDTTIILEAPHELMELRVSSNSPICEGEDLIMESDVFPYGNIRWTGPNVFGSDDLNPTIENISPEGSGEYKIEAQYGYCKQVDTLVVVIDPFVNASIAGESMYCERDDISLMAEGAGENLSHIWTGPNDLVQVGSTLDISNISQSDGGYYEVTISNGACIDTVGMDIDVLTTPKLSYQEVITSDFCDPLFLSPNVIGQENIQYSWSPHEGLSCDDCRSPEVLPIVQDSYQLIVENSNLCSDSINVQVELDKSKMAYAPNIFIPNSLTENDRFTLFPGCIVSQVFRLEIFDRWGSSVFKSNGNDTNGTTESWSGYIQGRVVNAGVYVWNAEVELIDGSIEYLTGSITLL